MTRQVRVKKMDKMDSTGRNPSRVCKVIHYMKSLVKDRLGKYLKRLNLGKYLQ